MFRWNSYYNIIRCIIVNIDKIEKVCNDLKLPIILGPRKFHFYKNIAM